MRSFLSLLSSYSKCLLIYMFSLPGWNFDSKVRFNWKFPPQARSNCQMIRTFFCLKLCVIYNYIIHILALLAYGRTVFLFSHFLPVMCFKVIKILVYLNGKRTFKQNTTVVWEMKNVVFFKIFPLQLEWREHFKGRVPKPNVIGPMRIYQVRSKCHIA